MRYARQAPAAFAVAALLLSALGAAGDETPRVLPAPSIDETKAQPGTNETAVLSGGCFWGMQGLFEHVKGVRRVVAGYSGGAATTAHYDEVSTGTTGNAESVQISFDPAEISYGEILRIFFSVAHDPTEFDRQGPDDGTQYRSEIWYANAQQEKIARAYLAQLGRVHLFGAPIVTRVDRFMGFVPAEGYHQDYLIKNPESRYIVINDLPKIARLKQLYPAIYRESPAKLG
jgi:peptide-methionine (S)-S-oxide reductase